MHSSVSAGAQMSAPDETRWTCTAQRMRVSISCMDFGWLMLLVDLRRAEDECEPKAPHGSQMIDAELKRRTASPPSLSRFSSRRT